MCKPGEECEGKGDAHTYMDKLADRVEAAFGQDFMQSVMPIINASFVVSATFDYALEVGSTLAKERVSEALENNENPIKAITKGVDDLRKLTNMNSNHKDAEVSMMEMRLRSIRLMLDELRVPQSIRLENKRLLTELVAVKVNFDEVDLPQAEFERDWAKGGVFTGMLEGNFCEMEADDNSARRRAKATSAATTAQSH